MTAEEVFAEVETLSGGHPITVSISGGNPAIQDFTNVIQLGQGKGYRFACETQGSVSKDWFSALDTLVLSPKPPSSGEAVDWSIFAKCVVSAGSKTQTVMKIVIFDDIDYQWAKTAAKRHPELQLYLQPGNPEVDPDIPVDLDTNTNRLLWLIEKVTGDRWFTPRVLPQLHVLVWGNKRGV